MRIRGFTLNHTIYGGHLNFPINDFNLKLGGMVIEPDPQSAEKFTRSL